MSTAEKVRKSVNDSIRNTAEFIEITKRSLQKELAERTPKIEHALDQSVDEAGQALSKALKSVEKKTSREQLELLNGYRRFLHGQVAFVDSRINAVKKAGSSS